MQNEIHVGDNLEIMKSEAVGRFSGSVSMIYIDPPYNTQTNKSYNDKVDSDRWREFMLERLVACRPFLKDTGSIFISIDDSEYAPLKVLCDEVFGKANFVGTFITLQAQRSNAKHINTVHEYILCYAKDKSKLPKMHVSRLEIPEDKKMIDSLYQEVRKVLDSEGLEAANKKMNSIVKSYCDEYNITWLRNYSNVDEDGRIFFAVDLSTPGEPRKVSIPEIGLHLDPLPTRGWSSDKKFIALHKENLLSFKDGRPYSKHFLDNATDNVPSILRFFSRQGTNDLKKLGLLNLFDTPKPVELIKFLIRISTEPGDIVMDFFGGSGTTGQAVYELNKEQGRDNSYLLMQLDEKVAKNSLAFKECEARGISPDVASILIYRLNSYLEQTGQSDEFKVFGLNK
jgi:adenine-specific DNA-methyltransferase